MKSVKTQTYSTPRSTVFRVFEIMEKAQFDESGNKPVYKPKEEIVPLNKKR